MLQIIVEDCRSSRGPPGTRGQKNGHPDGSLGQMYLNRLSGQNPWAILGPGLGTFYLDQNPIWPLDSPRHGRQTQPEERASTSRTGIFTAPHCGTTSDGCHWNWRSWYVAL